MNYYVKAYTIIAVIGLAFITGVSQYKRLDKSSKYIVVLTGFSFLCEILAHFFAVYAKNNYPIYNLYSVVEFFLLTAYFNSVVSTLRRNNIGLLIGGLGVVLGIMNLLFLQPINTFNSNFLFIEGFVIIGLSLYSFYDVLIRDDDIILNKMPTFWFNSVFLLYWSATYLTWPVYNLVQLTFDINPLYIDTSLWFVSLLMYSIISIVFIRYTKLKAPHVK